MKPFKVKNLLPGYAVDLDRPVDEVQAVINFYYKKVRQKLSALDTVNLQIENLGTFYIKERAIDTAIISNQRYISELSDLKIKEYEIKLEIKKKTDLMLNIKSLLNEERSRRKFVIDKRFNNEHNTNMEE